MGQQEQMATFFRIELERARKVLENVADTPISLPAPARCTRTSHGSWFFQYQASMERLRQQMLTSGLWQSP